MRVGILTDFPSISVQSGPAIHTRFLHDGLKRRGHGVTLIGPDTNAAEKVPTDEALLLQGIPYPSHPKVKVVVPSPLPRLWNGPKLDIIHGQVNNHIICYANWLRRMHRTAVINTNIIHLPSHSHFVLSDSLFKNEMLRDVMRETGISAERQFARLFNEGDAFIVQSRYMVDYWRERGVTVPIEVVGRPIDPAKFSQQAECDPFPSRFKMGKRLIVVCRHDREKALDQLIRIFDQQLAPADDDVTLTLVGNGHDHDNLVAQAKRSRYADRIHFSGEVKHARLVDWYAHADLFTYTSVSETFGNVVNEALWTGLPVVALNDRMGVAHQVLDGVNGALIEPDRTDTEQRFAEACLNILGNRDHRRLLGENAATIARRTSHPDVVLSRFERIYEQAIRKVHDEVKEPLSQQGKAVQMATFAKAIGTWGMYTSALFALANTTGKLGFGRKEIEVMSGESTPNEPSKPAFAGAEASL
jgi:glycosyltransferase involved in cell wall biosynthesis